MFTVAVSGQNLGFCFISAFSGTPLTGLSGFVSGYKVVDGGTQSAISGYVIEAAFGQYTARLFDFDVSGKIISFYFTGASGAIPVEKTVITTLNVSGRVFPASGIFATILPASLSGTFANVPITTISGVNAVVPGATLSGTLFLASGAMSGQQVTLTSGQSWTASGIWPASGAFVVATASVASGSLYLASGSIFRETYASGVVGASGGFPTAWGNSGQSYSASGAFVTVPISSISGTEVVATASVASGSLYLASGSIFLNTFASGVVGGGSGNLPSAWGGSGAVTVGQNLDKSGYTASVISGTVFPASGAFVTVPIASISGVNAVVPPASLSGVFSTVPIASLSGVNAVTTISSGTVFLASGQSVQIASGASVIASLYSGAGPVSLSAADSPVLQTGTALSGGTSTITLQTALGTDNLPLGCVVKITGGTGAYQTRVITNYTNSTKIATVDNPWEVTPDATSVYTVVYDHLGRTTGNSFYAADLILWEGVAPSPLIDGQVQIVSGPFVTLPKSTISGVNTITSLTSGTTYLASGQSVALNSGQMVALYSGQHTAVWSGTSVNVFSGTVSLTSGEVFVRIPQGVLTRDFTAFSGLTVTGASGRCLVNAERKLVNRWSLAVTSGYLTVYQEDDSSVAYTQALTVASGAPPITSMDTQ